MPQPRLCLGSFSFSRPSISAPNPFLATQPRIGTITSQALRLMARCTRHPAPAPFQAPSHAQHQRLDRASATPAAFQFRLVARLGPSVSNTSFFSRPQTGPAWPGIISISAPPFLGPRSPASSPALRLMARWTRHPAPAPFQAPSHAQHKRLDQASATPAAFQFQLVARLGPSVSNTSFFSRPQTGTAWLSIISISAPTLFGPRSPASSPAL